MKHHSVDRPTWANNPNALDDLYEKIRLAQFGADQMVLQLQKMIGEAQAFGDQYAEVAFRTLIVLIHRDAEDYAAAAEEYHRATAMLREGECSRNRIRLTLAYCSILLRIGDSISALALLKEAESNARKWGVTAEIPSCLSSIAAAYGGLGDHGQAAQCCRALLEEFDINMRPDTLVTVYSNLAHALSELGHYNEAREYLAKAVTYQSLIPGRAMDLLVSANLVVAKCVSEGFEETVLCVEQIRESYPSFRNGKKIFESMLLEIAQCFYRQGLLAKALFFLDKLIQFDENDPFVLQSANYLMSKVLIAQGRTIEAYERLDSAYDSQSKSRQSQIDERVKIALLKQERDMILRQSATLTKAKVEAEAANSAKTHFMGQLSHDIRNPLNGLLGIASILSKTDLSTQQSEYVRLIESLGQNLHGVLQGVLDIAEIESGRFELKHREFNFAEFVFETSKGLALGAHKKDVEINVFDDPNLNCLVIGDKGRIGQILTNLLSNAIKFTETGEINVRFQRVKALGPVPCCALRLEISDTGIGIDHQSQNAIFQPFTQADESTRNRFGGNGLGLSICKSLVEKMDGTLGVNSQIGQGSTFWFEISLREGSQLDKEVKMKYNGLKATLVGDNPTLWNVVIPILIEGDIFVQTVQSISGSCARPDLWVIDLDHVPNAPDHLERIRNSSGMPTTPAVFLTQIGKHDHLLNLMQIPHSQTVLKPLRRDHLEGALSELFIERQPLPQAVLNVELGNSVRGKILLAEDNEVNQLVESDLLIRLGFEVQIANNGLEAIEMMRTFDFDAILMDCQMPEMNGYEATRIIRSECKHSQIPIIAVTGNSLSSDREECLSSGMDDILCKPLTLEMLREKLDQIFCLKSL